MKDSSTTKDVDGQLLPSSEMPCCKVGNEKPTKVMSHLQRIGKEQLMKYQSFKPSLHSSPRPSQPSPQTSSMPFFFIISSIFYLSTKYAHISLVFLARIFFFPCHPGTKGQDSHPLYALQPHYSFSRLNPMHQHRVCQSHSEWLLPQQDKIPLYNQSTNIHSRDVVMTQS